MCALCGAIQKLPTSSWYSEIKKIYDTYQIYHLSSGREQPIFAADGSANPRSCALVNFVTSNASLARSGRLIDIGCGNGAALANFAAALPDWRFSGAELSEAALPFLRGISTFERLYTIPPSQISDRFDVVTMIHALEHMPSPYEALQNASRLLTAGGYLFVEVPDVATSPFDILVADHLLHATPHHLAYLAARAGFKAIEVRDDVLPKEISMLAVHGYCEVEKPEPRDGRVLVESNLSWLQAVIEAARDAAYRARVSGLPFGIFGTSIAGMWLFGALNEDVAFFVDEDVDRLGAEHDGIPILSPSQVPLGALVFVPLAPAIARRVVTRLSGGPASYQLPPEMNNQGIRARN